MRDVLGPRANEVKRLIRAPSGSVMPHTESTILWVRKNLPGHADEIIERTCSNLPVLVGPQHKFSRRQAFRDC